MAGKVYSVRLSAFEEEVLEHVIQETPGTESYTDWVRAQLRTSLAGMMPAGEKWPKLSRGEKQICLVFHIPEDEYRQLKALVRDREAGAAADGQQS